jgi:hypothetical protein
MAKKSKKSTAKVEKVATVEEVKAETPVVEEGVTATTANPVEAPETTIVAEENKEVEAEKENTVECCNCVGKDKCDCDVNEPETVCEEKSSIFTRAWKYVVTGVTCAAVGVGITLGADAYKVQETLTKAQANQVAMLAAAYSAEQVLNKITSVPTSDDKIQAIKEALVVTQDAMPEFMEAVTVVKETVQETKTTVTETIQNVKDVTTETK